jgi:hypothetical protein
VNKEEFPALIFHIALQVLSNQRGWDKWYCIKNKKNALKI